MTEQQDASVNFQDADAVIELMDEAARQMLQSPHRDGSVHWLPDEGRLLLTGDIHDNPRNFRIIMRLAALDAGSNRHVMLHELIHGDHLIHGTDVSYRTLCRVASVMVQYPGQVHPLIGNHEIAQAFEMRVTKGFGEQVALFDAGLDLMFGDRWEEVGAAIDRFILAMPLAVRSRRGLFLSHSTPNPRQLSGYDISVFKRSLRTEDYAALTGPAWQLTWGRGQTRESVDRFCAMVDAQLLVCGHALVEDGAMSLGPRLLLLNSDHDRGAVVPLHLGGPLPTAEELTMESLPLRAFEDVY